MIIVDTNLISEAMKPNPNPAVLTWLNNQVAETLYLSSVTMAEMLFGIAALPTGKRKNTLTQVLNGLLELFKGRVLPFDADAARYYAELAEWQRVVAEYAQYQIVILLLLLYLGILL